MLNAHLSRSADQHHQHRPQPGDFLIEIDLHLVTSSRVTSHRPPYLPPVRTPPQNPLPLDTRIMYINLSMYQNQSSPQPPLASPFPHMNVGVQGGHRRARPRGRPTPHVWSRRWYLCLRIGRVVVVYAWFNRAPRQGPGSWCVRVCWLCVGMCWYVLVIIYIY